MSRITQTIVAPRDHHDCRKATRASGCIERWYYRLATLPFHADPSVLAGTYDTGKSAALRRLGATLQARDATPNEHPSESGLARIADFNPATEDPSS